jgi:hypothetical protein
LKKVFAIIGSIIVVILIAIASVTGYNHYLASKYEDTAIPYVKRFIPEMSKWQPEIITGYMPRESLESTPEENIVKIVEYLSKLGALKSMEEPVFSKVYSGAPGKDEGKTVVVYTVNAVYETGDAEITVNLLETEESFKVYNFHINSLALLN